MLVPADLKDYAAIDLEELVGYAHILDSGSVDSALLEELQTEFDDGIVIFRGHNSGDVIIQFGPDIDPNELRAWLIREHFEVAFNAASMHAIQQFTQRHLGATATP